MAAGAGGAAFEQVVGQELDMGADAVGRGGELRRGLRRLGGRGRTEQGKGERGQRE